MIFNTLLVSIVLSVLPVSGLRGGLPFALARGVPLIPAYLICVLANALVGGVVLAGIIVSTVYLPGIKAPDMFIK